MEQPPMGDASSSLPADPQEPMPEPPMDGGEPPMDDNMGSEVAGSEKAQEITDIANEISEKDQETLLAYARSLKDTSEEAGAMPDGDAGMGGPEVPQQDPVASQAPMMESVIFTKKQIKAINEGLAVVDNETDREKPLGHTTKLKTDKNKPVSPFDPPRKNRK